MIRGVSRVFSTASRDKFRCTGASVWLTGPASPFKDALKKGLSEDLRNKGLSVFELDFRKLNYDVEENSGEAIRRIACVANMLSSSEKVLLIPCPYASRYNNSCDVEIDTSSSPFINTQADINASQILDISQIYDQTFNCLIHKRKVFLETGH